MKPITLNPVSVLVGAALVGMSLVLSGAAQTTLIAHPLPRPEPRLIGEIPAEWWTYVELTSSQSFVVPAHHYFVVTACLLISVDVRANGIAVNALNGVNQHFASGNGNGTRVSFAPGTVLTEEAGVYTASLWGYLEPVL